MIEWQWSTFLELSNDDLYEIIRAREAVFVVEQNCAYQETDGLDKFAIHLMGWERDGDKKELVAYLRLLPPNTRFKDPSFGRIITTKRVRGTGVGKMIMAEAMRWLDEKYPGSPIRISAQQHLEKYYEKFGFIKNSDPYDEDGIPHIEMVRNGKV